MATVAEHTAAHALPAEDAPPATPPAGAVHDVVEYELLFDCVHCGLCLESCPTYIITRAEMDSPRGRIYLMKALAEGRLALDRDAVRHLDLCLGCRGCETACPSGVKYGRLIEHARGYLKRNWRRSLIERLREQLIRQVFPFPARLRALLKPVGLMERIGLRGPLRRLFPAAARAWLDLLPDARQQQSAALVHEQHQTLDAIAGTPSDEAVSAPPGVVVHHGCVAQVLTPSANLNSERALEAAGYRVVRLAKAVCCGALDIHHGDFDRAREFARINVAALAASGADAIVSAASGCSSVIAQYGELLKDDRDYAAQAREIAARVTDLSSLLLNDLTRSQPSSAVASRLPGPGAERSRDRKERAGSKFSATVTYHDSCHLVHGLGVREPPRQLLRSLPGVKLVELAESDLCCGSAGSYNLTERVMAQLLAERKVDNIIATGAQYVVVSNPGCEFQIAAELRRRGSPVRAVHMADFLAIVRRNEEDLD